MYDIIIVCIAVRIVTRINHIVDNHLSSCICPQESIMLIFATGQLFLFYLMNFDILHIS